LQLSMDDYLRISYRDMTRIADAMRMEGPKVLGLALLPSQVDAGLQFAISAVDPNKVRSKKNMKKGMSALSGGSGLALATVCLGNLLNPGAWAVVAAFFTGGIAGGPLQKACPNSDNCQRSSCCILYRRYCRRTFGNYRN